jgi:hypothetical protein
VDLVTTGKGGSHALAAICVILLAAFAVFCSYYPWKIPSAIPPHATSTNGIALSSAAPARVKIDRRFRDQKSAASGASFDVRSPALKRGNKTAARS